MNFDSSCRPNTVINLKINTFLVSDRDRARKKGRQRDEREKEK